MSDMRKHEDLSIIPGVDGARADGAGVRDTAVDGDVFKSSILSAFSFLNVRLKR